MLKLAFYAAAKVNTDNNSNDSKKKAAIDSEFISDTFKTSEKDLEEVKAGLKILGIDTLVKQQQADVPADGKISHFK